MNYTYSKNAQKWLHFIRYEETISCLELLPEPPLKILEIGAGDGYIASIFSGLGYNITSIDNQPRYPSSFPVKKMNAEQIIFPENTYDIIFSSNVLEHIKDLEPVFKELKRVAKENALFIFVLPTPAWRIISTIWYFISFFKLLFSKLFNSFFNRSPNSLFADKNTNEILVEIENVSLLQKIKRLIIQPHGEYPSSFHEIYYFSPFRWKRLFIENRFNIISHKRGPLFYSGESFFSFRFIRLRKFLAEYFFSSVHIYLLKSN